MTPFTLTVAHVPFERAVQGDYTLPDLAPPSPSEGLPSYARPAATPNVFPLRQGATGQAVMDVQADLINMGYLAYGLPMSQWHTEADGIFGPKTHAAVVAFQRSITGQAGTGILTEPQAQIADAEARRIASGQPTTSRHPRSQLSDGQPVKPGASSAPTSLFTRALVGVAVGVGAAILFSD